MSLQGASAETHRLVLLPFGLFVRVYGVLGREADLGPRWRVSWDECSNDVPECTLADIDHYDYSWLWGLFSADSAGENHHPVCGNLGNTDSIDHAGCSDQYAQHGKQLNTHSQNSRKVGAEISA